MALSIVTREMTLATSDDVADLVASSAMSEEEFRAFYDRTARSLWLYLVRIAGDRQTADDLLQETYYRFYRAAVAHESEQHRRNSLFMIATNLVRDSHRRRTSAGRDAEHTSEETEMIADRTSSPEKLHLRTDLARALAQLKPQQREMLLLAYAWGSSHEEIARTVGVTVASVKSLLLRARRKLANILRDGEVER